MTTAIGFRIFLEGDPAHCRDRDVRSHRADACAGRRVGSVRGLRSAGRGEPHAGHDLAVPGGDGWRQFDRRRAVEPRGPLVDGLEATCADQRVWSIDAVDRRRTPDDLVPLAVAGVLEQARARAGWPAVEIAWDGWRRVYPELPEDELARGPWLFAHALRRGKLAGGAVAYLAGHVPTSERPA